MLFLQYALWELGLGTTDQIHGENKMYHSYIFLESHNFY